MKWEEPPLWPVAVPSITGFVSACIPHVIEGVPRLLDWDLTSPFVILVAGISSFILFFAPKPVRGNFEVVIGTIVGMLFAFIPQLAFFVWFVVVILLWLFESMHVWRKNYPPFRIGIWIGLGAVSGLYIGGLFAHFVL
tara:strand:- start:637 stop:1050 length:414 start_codon:yes stop_codon:yes gene_type:complete